MTPEARGWSDVRKGSSCKPRVQAASRSQKGAEADSPIELLAGTNKTDFGFLASRTVEE